MVDKVEIIDKVREIVGRYENVSIKEDDNLEKIDVSDLSKVQIAMELERVFCIDFELEDITKLKTVNDIVTFIENQNS